MFAKLVIQKIPVFIRYLLRGDFMGQLFGHFGQFCDITVRHFSLDVFDDFGNFFNNFWSYFWRKLCQEVSE